MGAIEFLFGPGRRAVEIVPLVSTETPTGFALAVLLSAFVWATLLRLAWTFVARPFGLYSPDHFAFWVSWLPWRPLYNGTWIKLRDWFSARNFGRMASADWASLPETLAALYRPGTVYLGRARGLFGLPWFQPVGVRAERHLAMVAGTGSGKTTLLMTLLGLHRGSSLVVDPKGQITKVLARRSGIHGPGFGVKKGHHARILDPEGVVNGLPKARWNPIDEIDLAVKREGPDAAVRYAEKIAHALVMKSPMEKPFFPDSARNFLMGLVLYVYVAASPELRNLVRVRELLSNGLIDGCPKGKSPFMWLLFKMSERLEFGGVISGRAESLMRAGDTARGNILATLDAQTGWLDRPEVRAIMTTSDFRLEELKTTKLNLFLCAPVSDIQGPLSGWFRLFVVLSLYIFERVPGRLKEPCLFALDEMPSLGHVEAIETAAPVMRSYGVRLLCVTQDLERLTQAYPKAWGGFLGNAEVVWWLGGNHQNTFAHLETVLGKRTRREDAKGLIRKRGGRLVDRELMLAEQLRRFLGARGNILVTRYGKRPLRLKNAPYFKELPVTHYDHDRDFPEAPLRALSRRVLQGLLGSGGGAGRMSTAEAQAIYGLNPPYTAQEVQSRYALMQPSAARNLEFAATIRQARDVLLAQTTP